jgi:MoxR-like ATPase
MRAMQTGAIARVEELTRVPSDVQDALITILSEKTLPVPELNTEVQAQRGFNLIATANDRDRGVNELSSALRRRFNTVVLPMPASADDEVEIVARRVSQLGRSLDLPEVPAALEEIRRVVTIFRELRSGLTEDGRTKLKSPTGTPTKVGALDLPHRLAVAPMTRNRARTDGVPTDLNREYYRQRASMALIIAEATQISDDAQGYMLTPGIYTEAHIAGWQEITGAVHAAAGPRRVG